MFNQNRPYEMMAKFKTGVSHVDTVVLHWAYSVWSVPVLSNGKSSKLNS